MAQNKGEEKISKDSTEQPSSSQVLEPQAKKQQTEQSKSDQAADALAQLEADLKAEKQQENVAKPADKSTQKTLDKKQHTQSKQQAEKAKPQVVKSKSWLAVFAFLLSLVALAAAGFIWWQNQLWLKNQEQVELIKQQSLLTTQQTLNQQQAQITDLLTKLSQQAANQQTTKQTIAAVQARVSELGESQPNYWLAAEANYLINLAERRLLVEQDADTAIQLLLDANMRLAAMQDPSVFHIRTAISQDIAALKVVKQPNTDDIYLALSGLLSQAQQLPFAQVYIPDVQEQIAQAQQVNDNIDDWQQNLMVSVKRFFAHFITIRKQDTQVQPQLPADQQWFVRANIRTELLMAQNAVLDKNQQRYQDAVKIIKQWTQQYFDKSKAEVVAFIIALEHLSEQNVELALPEQLAAQALSANFVLEQLKLKQESTDVKPEQAQVQTEAVTTEDVNND